ENRGPSRQQRGEQRGPVALGQRPERRRLPLAQREGEHATRVVLLGRARMVGGKRQHLGRAVQDASPVLHLVPQHVGRHPPPLPRGIVGGLQRQRRKGVALAARERRVQR